jgi:3-dehydroquinate synthase
MKIDVNLGINTYQIHIEHGIFNNAAKILIDAFPEAKFAIISDDTVAGLYAKNLKKALDENKKENCIFTFKPGDQNKSLKNTEKIITKLLDKEYKRKDVIIGLGGGVTGDLAGFIASIYKRGINFAQIPTSLLAMVDASIGGKTGINMPEGKNLIGTFYQPKLVLVDPALLPTLPQEEYLNGLSEAVKYASIYDKELFSLIEDNINPIQERNHQLLLKIISRCCAIKAEVVEKDEKENGLRMILNYGHTFGHAIEKISKYQITHGQAIAIGMKLINLIAANKGLAKQEETQRVKKLIDDLKLAGPLESWFIKKASAGKIWDQLRNDKKSDNKINFIIIPHIGTAKIVNDIEKADLARTLKMYT